MLLKVKGNDAPPIDIPKGARGFWRRATFSVPADVTEERVQLLAHRYIQRAAETWQMDGLTVLHVGQPVALKVPEGESWEESWRGMERVEPDRRKYVMFGYVSQRPQERMFGVSDALVPEMVTLGLKPV